MSVHYANISGLHNNYDSCIVDVGYKSKHWNLVSYLQDSYTIIILQGYIGTML